MATGIGLVWLLGCADAADEPQATETATGFTEYDPDSRLLVKGRDRYRVCVEVLDDTVSVQEARTKIAEALDVASSDERWHSDYGSPEADAECPLPPAALDTSKPAYDRMICRREVSLYLKYVFVGHESLFEERFPPALVDANDGQRRAPQEGLGREGLPCSLEVAEGWFLTGVDLRDPELLEQYIFFRARGR